jgi:hypothetical protein
MPRSQTNRRARKIFNAKVQRRKKGSAGVSPVALDDSLNIRARPPLIKMSDEVRRKIDGLFGK